MTKEIRLSPSTLNLFLECPRCFWLHINPRVKRPRGIFPSLPGGMDLVIKNYFDSCRKKGLLPKELQGKVEGMLFPDQKLLDKWRSWRTGLTYRDKAKNALLFGALDDCLKDGHLHIPLDYKTRGYPPDNNSQKYYGNQLSCYSFLLQENGYNVPNWAYLVYYYPNNVKEEGRVKFDIQVVKLESIPGKGKDTFLRAVKLLQSPIPPQKEGCEYCAWLLKRSDFESNKFPKDLFA